MAFLPFFFTAHVSSAIAARGRSYRNRVRIIKKKIGIIEAYVFGTQRYTASITKTGESQYEDACTCPYGATCKHTIALAYVIEASPEIKIVLEKGSAAHQKISTLIPIIQDRGYPLNTTNFFSYTLT